MKALATLALASALMGAPEQQCMTLDMMQERNRVRSHVSTNLCATPDTEAAEKISEFWEKFSQKLEQYGFELTVGSDVPFHVQEYTEVTISGDMIYSHKLDKLVKQDGFIFIMIKNEKETRHISVHVSTLDDIDNIIERFVSMITAKEV